MSEGGVESGWGGARRADGPETGFAYILLTSGIDFGCRIFYIRWLSAEGYRQCSLKALMCVIGFLHISE